MQSCGGNDALVLRLLMLAWLVKDSLYVKNSTAEERAVGTKVLRIKHLAQGARPHIQQIGPSIDTYVRMARINPL